MGWEQIPLDRHRVHRAIAIDKLRVLYVPVPKAGCTAILWTLAELAGLKGNRFHRSLGREVSPGLTIHHLSRWPQANRFGERSPGRRREVLDADDWFRFTVVRHPFRRLWSAWQSKILLAEPQFSDKFAAERWFPGSVGSAGEIYDAFRAFIHALGDHPELARADVHWAPQVELIGYPDATYEHVGRVEKLAETMARLRKHARKIGGPRPPAFPRTNVMPLPYVPQLFGEADVEILGHIYSGDLKVFGYRRPPKKALVTPLPRAWRRSVDAFVPALTGLRARNARVGDMYRSSKAEQARCERQQKRLKKVRAELKELRGREDRP